MTDDNTKDDDAKDDDAKNDLQKKVEEAEQDAKETAEEATVTEDAPQGNEVEELKNALARSMADLQNFKRRAEEDKFRFIKFANVELLKALLPSIDNFDRSANHLPEDLKDNEWVKGVLQIHDDMLATLEKMGVKKMKTMGEKLDPSRHEALMADKGEKDVIIEEFESGYLYNDEVLKPAKVKVGNGE